VNRKKILQTLDLKAVGAAFSLIPRTRKWSTGVEANANFLEAFASFRQTFYCGIDCPTEASEHVETYRFQLRMLFTAIYEISFPFCRREFNTEILADIDF